MKTREFVQRSRIDAPAEAVFGWHLRPGALERLTPPWEDVEVVEITGGPETVGSRVTLKVKTGPLAQRWVAEHTAFDPAGEFRDEQISGPFRVWRHTHSVKPDGDGCVLEDRVEYALPFGALGRLVGGGFVESKLDRMFSYRHDVTAHEVCAHANTALALQDVAVTGAGGLVGSSLVPFLTTGGHRVRPVPRDGHSFDVTALEGATAVVHLAGESIAEGRWNDAKKKRIRESRVEGTRQVAEAIAAMEQPPAVFVCASAIGFYGDRGDEELTEASTGGEGFLADVCKEWEAATDPARAAGVRVVNLRFGVILSAAGGALAKMLTPFKLGGGGRIGGGRQFMSWISVDDVVGAIHHALATPALEGPVNAVAPGVVTNVTFTKTLGRVLRRPTIVPMPAFAARLAFGEMADELLLASARVLPRRLEETGYAFRDPELEPALRRLLGVK